MDAAPQRTELPLHPGHDLPGPALHWRPARQQPATDLGLEPTDPPAQGLHPPYDALPGRFHDLDGLFPFSIRYQVSGALLRLLLKCPRFACYLAYTSLGLLLVDRTIDANLLPRCRCLALQCLALRGRIGPQFIFRRRTLCLQFAPSAL
jgi:hypothetical protein